MAEILEFRARPRSETEVAVHYAEAAKILFFTGVRYIRLDDDAAPDRMLRKPRRGGKAAASRKPRKRA